MKYCVIINVKNQQEYERWENDGFIFLKYKKFEVVQKQAAIICDHSETNKGKWGNIQDHLWEQEWIWKTEYFWFPDPDLEMSDWKEFLEYAASTGYGICQPSLTRDSKCSYSFHKNMGKGDRVVPFCEVMCPVFTRAALLKCLPYFSKSFSGYGLDLIWGKLMENFIIDRFQIRHRDQPHFVETAKAEGLPDPDAELIAGEKMAELIR